ncbi:MAG: MFS transporter [Verrucomicrobia bacterium]|nr:MFS transporter [Verrucomicrobiota bacterium]
MNGVSEREAGPPGRPVVLRAWLDRYFGRRVVYAWERPSIMRKHIYTGAMGNVWASLISGIFFVYFGTTIGLTRFQWGVMAGISSWLIATQLLSALLTQRTGRRKVIWFWFAIGERSLRLLGILIAFALWHTGWPHAGVVLIAAICLANLCGTMATPPWLSWLADIIPHDEHGAFWGRRTAWIAVTVVIVVVAAGLLADKIPPAYKLQAIVGIFIVATVVGILDLVIHGTIPEPSMLLPVRNHFWQHVLEPLRDPAFRPWLLFNVAWTFAMTIGGALATIYFLDELHLRENFFGGVIVVTCIPLLGTLLSGKWSGKLVDRLGTKPVLYWAHIAWALLPVFWFAASPATALVVLGISSAQAGVACTAAATAANKLITRVPPPQLCPMYTAVSTSLGSMAAGLGALGAGSLLGALGDWHVTTSAGTFGGFHVLFAISLVLRLAAALVLVPRLHAGSPKE